MDDDFQRRLDQILLDIKGLEDLIRDIQSPKKSSEKEVKEKIKVGPETIGRRMCTDRSSPESKSEALAFDLLCSYAPVN